MWFGDCARRYLKKPLKDRAQWDGHCARVDGDGRGRVALFLSVIVEQVFGFVGFLVWTGGRRARRIYW